MNEVPFLKDIDKTPTFLLYNKKNKTYKLIPFTQEELD